MTTAFLVNSVTKMKKILFVCTGNTCRSPIAEALFNTMADNKKYHAESCGIYGDGISPISINAKEVLAENGIEFSHISTPISVALVKDADYIIGMTANHARSIIAMFPEYSDKVFTMPSDISDPYGGNIEVYRFCRDEIEECIRGILQNFEGDING